LNERVDLSKHECSREGMLAMVQRTAHPLRAYDEQDREELSTAFMLVCVVTGAVLYYSFMLVCAVTGAVLYDSPPPLAA
jgi:hypothetical protein